jgi:hypothetical protein
LPGKEISLDKLISNITFDIENVYIRFSMEEKATGSVGITLKKLELNPLYKESGP